VYGVGPVRELLRAKPGSIDALAVEARRGGKERGDDPVAEIVRDARAAGIRIDTRSRDQLDQLVGPDARHQGVVAMVRGEPSYVDLDAIVAAASASGRPALVVALDGVEDPRNLGAVLRSAYLLGAHGVIVPSDRAASVTPAVTKASAGASELIAIAQVGNLARALDELKQLGPWLVAVHAAPASRPIDEIDLTGPIGLVLGAEGRGVRPLVAKQCDFHAVIPMAQSGVGSFNVSVAAAIALYEVQRQRITSAGRAL
jgi:23S rRNA (guanosine2251-2'-O)-methyltransferase